MIDKNIRPISVTSDLKSIANLLYECFQEAMDEDGERYISYLRRISETPLFAKIAQRNPEKYSLPGEGFVYKERDKVIGNITLSLLKAKHEFVYVISNVAVRPDARGRGIAKALTETALRYIESKGVRETWLQVKNDNQAALRLYDDFGFETFMTRTTWAQKKANTLFLKETNTTVHKRKKADWSTQRDQFAALHPAELTASFGFEIASFQPSLKQFIIDSLHDRIKVHWMDELGEAKGFISYELIPYQTYANLWLAVPQEKSAESHFLRTLIPFANSRLGKEIRVNYPAGRAEESFGVIGMHPLNTLHWKKRKII
ncbi:MAG: GNAT family N-acetyltransferase [Chloroflexi bacterium]|nr:GNAT family N-acetyltransferase [Chloroflexota bacterium]